MQLNKDLGIAIFYVVFGSVFAIGGLQYELGTLEEMDSGYFPVMIGSILIFVGLLNYLKSFKSKETVELKFKIPLTITALIMLTYIITEFVGFIIASTVLVWASAALHPKFSVKGTVVINLVVVTLILVLKHTLLRNLPIW
jgi:hypothetical protein